MYSLARNKILNVAFAISSAGELIILAIMVGILKVMHVDTSVENNNKGYSTLIAFSGAVWREWRHLISRTSFRGGCSPGASFFFPSFGVFLTSCLCSSVVLHREAQTGSPTTCRQFICDDWICTDMGNASKVFSTEAK